MRGAADFFYLLFYGWLVVYLMHLVFGGIMRLITHHFKGK